MPNPLTGVAAARTRKKVYAVYSFLGLAIGGIQAAYGSISAPSPDWLKITLSVYAFIGTAIGATAASNVVSTPTGPPDAQPS